MGAHRTEEWFLYPEATVRRRTRPTHRRAVQRALSRARRSCVTACIRIPDFDIRHLPELGAVAVQSNVCPRILGLIPARGGSKGIPQKNLRPLAGKPLIEYTCAAALASRRLVRIIVSTDCPAIAKVACAAGCEVPFLRPNHLATDSATSASVVRHALDWLAQHGEPWPDLVALLQPTAPLRTAWHIDQAVALLESSGSDSVVSVTSLPAHYHPEWQFVIRAGELRSYADVPLGQLVPRRQELAPTYTRNGAIYLFRTQAFAATGSLYGDRCCPYVMPPEVSVNIDTHADWRRAERLLAGQETEATDAA
jgi:CMP-N,N'-diacetyllegionaminic acid synthase